MHGMIDFTKSLKSEENCNVLTYPAIVLNRLYKP